MQDERVTPADNNNTAIAVAKEYGHQEVVDILLQDPTVASTYGQHISRESSFTDLVSVSENDSVSVDISDDEIPQQQRPKDEKE